MGYGSYIADAAEGERTRRHSTSQLEKQLAMHKYGVDTSAATAANRLDFDIDKWRPEEDRSKYAQTQLEQSVAAGENVSNLIASNLQEEGLVSQKIEDVGKYRWEDKPSMWDFISGKRTYSDWATGVGSRVVDWAGFGISDKDIVGDPLYKDNRPGMLKDIDPNQLMQLLVSQGLLDPNAISNKSTPSLLGLSNPSNWQTNIQDSQKRGW